DRGGVDGAGVRDPAEEVADVRDLDAIGVAGTRRHLGRDGTGVRDPAGEGADVVDIDPEVVAVRRRSDDAGVRAAAGEPLAALDAYAVGVAGVRRHVDR